MCCWQVASLHEVLPLWRNSHSAIVPPAGRSILEEGRSAMPADATLTCRDCGQAFTFTSGEQDFYAARGYSEPGRCPDCRAARKAERGGGGGGGYSSYGSGGGGGYGGG